MSQVGAYSAEHIQADGVPAIELTDRRHDASVMVTPSLGNMAIRFRKAGEDVLWFPFERVADFRDNPAMCGIPFLGPWANRLDHDGFWANGGHFRLNPDLGNLHRDGNGKPIHGLLNFSPHWEPESAGADSDAAWTTSRLDFARHPHLMAQFPFAHTIRMTHRLSGGALEVSTEIANRSAEPLPVAIGYHPYFRLPGVPRDEWEVTLAAREHLVLDGSLIPNGERRPLESPVLGLCGRALDDVYAGLVREPDGMARFSVGGRGRRITVSFGPRYTVAVVYAPGDHDFVCFEPMSAVTNALNSGHELQSVAPDGVWRESFHVKTEGF